MTLAAWSAGSAVLTAGRGTPGCSSVCNAKRGHAENAIKNRRNILCPNYELNVPVPSDDSN